MFRSIVVPLDGSPDAAKILAYIPLVAAPDARVTLVGVAEPFLEGPAASMQGRDLADQVEQTRAYLWQSLEHHANLLREQGIQVVTTVHTGEVTYEILACARETEADLIAIASYATRDLSSWMLRSTTQRLVSAVSLPTLIVRASADSLHTAGEIDSVIVPLDGWSIAEEAIPTACELASHLGVSLRAVRVVPDPASVLVQTGASDDAASAHRLTVALEQALTSADHYIRSTADRLRGTVRDVTGDLRIGDPTAALSTYCAEHPGALVVMATHGSGGGDWWSYGSVAEKLVPTIPNPILILRPLAANRGRMRHDPAIAARYPD